MGVAAVFRSLFLVFGVKCVEQKRDRNWRSRWRFLAPKIRERARLEEWDVQRHRALETANPRKLPLRREEPRKGNPDLLAPRGSWLRLSMEDPTPPLDTPEVFGENPAV